MCDGATESRASDGRDRSRCSGGRTTRPKPGDGYRWASRRWHGGHSAASSHRRRIAGAEVEQLLLSLRRREPRFREPTLVQPQQISSGDGEAAGDGRPQIAERRTDERMTGGGVHRTSRDGLRTAFTVTSAADNRWTRVVRAIPRDKAPASSPPSPEHARPAPWACAPRSAGPCSAPTRRSRRDHRHGPGT